MEILSFIFRHWLIGCLFVCPKLNNEPNFIEINRLLPWKNQFHVHVEQYHKMIFNYVISDDKLRKTLNDCKNK